jgi:hypothetical protein
VTFLCVTDISHWPGNEARGYTHWASGRMEELEVNTHHPSFCHVQCFMKPSMRPGKYRVYILLGRDGDFATIVTATCECAAGYVTLTIVVLM